MISSLFLIAFQLIYILYKFYHKNFRYIAKTSIIPSKNIIATSDALSKVTLLFIIYIVNSLFLKLDFKSAFLILI